MEHIVNDHILIDGTRIAHGVHGEGDPVVFLHGTPSSSLIWRNVMPRLVEAGYKVHGVNSRNGKNRTLSLVDSS